MIAPSNTADVTRYVDLLVKLNELNRRGLQDSDEADLLRDEMDAPWYQMTDEDRDFVGGLSADLYTLADDDVIKHASDERVFSASLAGAVRAARDAKNYRQVLKLLRERAAEVSAYRAAWIRARMYEALSWEQIADLFFQRACDLETREGTAYATFIDRLLKQGDYKRAIELAQQREMIPDPIKMFVSVLFSQAALEHRNSGQSLVDTATLLLRRTGNVSGGQVGKWTSSDLREIAGIQLAIALRELRDVSAAIEELNYLPLKGANADLAHALRAIWHLELGNHTPALDDFTAAVRLRVPLDAPYVYVAHHALTQGRFEDCLKLCWAALSLGSEHAAELHEWTAICLSELEAPDELAIAHFSAAIEAAPDNERIRKNFDVFRAKSDFLDSVAKPMFHPSVVNLSGAVSILEATKQLTQRRAALFPTVA